MSGLCRSWLGHADGLAVDRADNPFPARQSFLEAEFDGSYEIVALASEIRVWYLLIPLEMDSGRFQRGNITYLFHDQVHILAAAFFLVAHVLVLDLRAGL